MADQLHFEDVTVGDQITTLRTSVDEIQMFLFSAATYNAHRIHYDKSWAVDVEGYSGPLVQGPLQAALLARAVTDWIGGAGTLVTYSAQNRAVAFAGQELDFVGTVTAKREEDGRALVDLEIRGERDGELLMPGTATVTLPRRTEAA
ncbi:MULTISPECIES: MaoC/PaaZ C-terminal domain-containing protein [unclassified Rhodococcus (in: high G+C Gram-positive bacteria)]|uniref:MaoC/PaaZ C-terminal domain-containing protein n=1 Tax=unclassified Rhodococcus (in: high G+C Gram-positive bacteria) TaxID=192944 RepID=UPI000A0D8BE0|nr:MULTISPECIES: MaoC/PaaZ C-terminal domain-containing protein [unclassified Rhodococcus (in: high G+C Gram-positive bacteria)]ORI27375.1 acyl dehydratase [Rhodococcus sp. 1168]